MQKSMIIHLPKQLKYKPKFKKMPSRLVSKKSALINDMPRLRQLAIKKLKSIAGIYKLRRKE